MNELLERNPELKKICVVYLDNVLIFSKTKQQPIRDVRKILKELAKARFKLQADKYDFDKNAMEFVGF